MLKKKAEHELSGWAAEEQSVPGISAWRAPVVWSLVCWVGPSTAWHPGSTVIRSWRVCRALDATWWEARRTPWWCLEE